MRKSISLLILVTVFLISSVVSFGQSQRPVVLSDGTIVNITSSNENIYDSGSSIDFYVKDNKIVASAYTSTFADSDSIYVKVSIEKYQNGRWVSVASDSDTNYNSDHVTANITITSFSAGKYRAYAIHQAKDNGTTESDITYTSSINVY